MCGLFDLIIRSHEAVFSLHPFSVDSLVSLTIRHYNRRAIGDRILMRKSAGGTGSGPWESVLMTWVQWKQWDGPILFQIFS